MFKKILAATVALMLCFALASCTASKVDGATCGDTEIVGVWTFDEQELKVTPEDKDEDEEVDEDEDDVKVYETRVMQFLSNGTGATYALAIDEDNNVEFEEESFTWYAENGIIFLDGEQMHYTVSGKKMEIKAVEFEDDIDGDKTVAYKAEYIIKFERSNKTALELMENVYKKANK